VIHACHIVAVAILSAKPTPPPPKPGDWSFGWESVGVIAAVSLAMIALIYATITYFRWRRRLRSNSPWCLFNELCSAHQLTRRQRHVIKRLAHQYKLAQPAMLFVEPKWWEPEQLGPTWARHLPELRRLRLRLFSHR